MHPQTTAVIIGAGPAGLTAACELLARSKGCDVIAPIASENPLEKATCMIGDGWSVPVRSGKEP